MSTKAQYWQQAILTPTGVAAGTYQNATFTVGEDGRLTQAASTTIPSVTPVSTVNHLATITMPTNGSLAVVMDDGAGDQELYVWRSTNPDVGAPLNRWKLMASTLDRRRTDFRQGTVAQDAITHLDNPIPDLGIVKCITVEITEAYSPGTLMLVQDNTGFVYMSQEDIDPQSEGVYKKDLATNLNTMLDNSGPGQGQIRVIATGVPSAGSAAVYVEYIVV